jgi:D-3-phosphoglycerate dehydrogenase
MNNRRQIRQKETTMTENWTILISAPYMLPVIDNFRPRLEAQGCRLVLADVDERLDEDALLTLIEGVDGVICGDDRFTARVIEAASSLKVISKWGTGIDSIDRAACAAHGVTVCNTPDAFSQAVADTVLGYMLNAARNLSAMNTAMKQGNWQKIPGRALHECTLGVIGVGNVGRAVLHRAQAFGMTLLGTDPVTPPTGFCKTVGLTMVSLPELMAQADFISINCDLNPTSFHLIDDDVLALAQQRPYLINTARGSIVDEAALVRALAQNRLSGAALDVFEVEPLPAASPLRSFENVMLAPHNANSSPQARAYVHENTIRNLMNVLTS